MLTAAAFNIFFCPKLVLDGFRQQREYLAKEFKELADNLEKMEEELKKAINEGTSTVINFVSATTMRELKSRATGLLENIILKKAYVDALDDVTLTVEMVQNVANDIDFFEDTSIIYELKSQLNYVCLEELQKPMWEGRG